MLVKLKEWALNYFNFRKAAMLASYKVVDKGEGGLELKDKNSIEEVLCQEELLKPPKTKNKLIMITLNKPKNIDFMAKNWDAFCVPGLRVYFVDPDNPHSKFVILPEGHNRVCEKSNIRKSLHSMSDAARATV